MREWKLIVFRRACRYFERKAGEFRDRLDRYKATMDVSPHLARRLRGMNESLILYSSFSFISKFNHK